MGICNCRDQQFGQERENDEKIKKITNRNSGIIHNADFMCLQNG